MKEPNLRKYHRNMGICIVFLILLQTGTGIFLSPRLRNVSRG